MQQCQCRTLWRSLWRSLCQSLNLCWSLYQSLRQRAAESAVPDLHRGGNMLLNLRLRIRGQRVCELAAEEPRLSLLFLVPEPAAAEHALEPATAGL